MQQALRGTVSDVRKGSRRCTLVSRRLSQAITISQVVRTAGGIAGTNGRQYGAINRPVGQNADNARQASELAKNAAQRRRRAVFRSVP